MHGIVLFAHGSRDPEWAEPFRQICQRVQSSRPEGASTVTATSRAPGSTATRPASIAQVTSAIVPWPHAVE